MRKLELAALLLPLLVAVPATASEVVNFDFEKRSCVDHGNSSWGYFGQLSWQGEGERASILLPIDWGRVHAACGRSLANLHRQSPIELPASPTLAAGDPREVEFPGYGRRQVQVEHNCHTVQATLVDDNDGEALRLDGQAYRLLQFHLHTPSEHVLIAETPGSINYPGEIHFVHAAVNDDGSLDGRRLAVVGVFMDLSEHDSSAGADAFFQALAADYAGHDTAAEEPIEIDLSQLKGANLSHWRYAGSLTTPPCDETVEWIVIAEPLRLSPETFRRVREAKMQVGFANARPPFLPTNEHSLRFVDR